MPGKDHSLVDTTALGEHGPASRRRFLQAVGLGGALSALPLVARSAGAQSGSTTTAAAGSETTASSTPVTTTTAPPRRPTGDDEMLLGFAQSIELSATAAYEAVLDRADELSLPEDVYPVIEVFREHHKAYGQSLSGLLGRTAPNTSNATADTEFGPLFTTGSLDEVLTAAIALEDTAVATHLTLLEQLQGTDGAALIASILVTEARHATVLSALSGNDALMPESGLEPVDAALTPDDYPVE
jgi:rubrerythrin